MKKSSFITLIAVLFSPVAFCQQFELPDIELKFNNPTQNFKIFIPNTKPIFKPITPINTLDKSKILLYKTFPIMLYSDRVIILPLDNMPCFVPRKYNSAKMPAYKGNEYLVKIPNALEKIPF